MSASIAVFVTRGSDHDERLRPVRLEALPENRMVVGDVRADQQDDVGALEVFVRAGRAVAAERQLVAGDRGRHAERRVAVVVARAEAELRELAERVELLGDELSGADDPDGVVAVLPLDAAKLRGHRADRLIPAHALQPAVAAQQRIAARACRRESFRARTGPSGTAVPALTG